MQYRPLEITVASAKDLKNVNLMTKMDVYAVVSINADPKTSQNTPVDKDCGSNPNWNHRMKFTIDEAAAQQNRLFLVFQLKSDRHLGDRDIGEVRVPIKELLDHNDANGKAEQFASYSVRTPNGKAKGTLNFSYKFGDKFSAPAIANVKQVENTPVVAYPPPQSGYPPQAAPFAYPYPPPHAYGGYPPPPMTTAPSYGYPAYPPQAGYGYPQVQKPKKHGGMGAGVGLGLGAGLLGGLLVGEMVSDVAESAAYMDGFEDGVDFDF